MDCEEKTGRARGKKGRPQLWPYVPTQLPVSFRGAAAGVGGWRLGGDIGPELGPTLFSSLFLGSAPFFPHNPLLFTGFFLFFLFFLDLGLPVSAPGVCSEPDWGGEPRKKRKKPVNINGS